MKLLPTIALALSISNASQTSTAACMFIHISVPCSEHVPADVPYPW